MLRMTGGHWNSKRFPFVKVPTDYSAEHRLLLLLFSNLVASDSLRPHGLRHARHPCSPLSPRVCSNSCLLSQWYYLTISSSVIPFSTCLQSYPESGSFPKSPAFPIRWPKYRSPSFSISPSSEYSGLISFRIHWFGLPAVQETLKSLFQHHSLRASVLQSSAFLMIQQFYPSLPPFPPALNLLQH